MALDTEVEQEKNNYIKRRCQKLRLNFYRLSMSLYRTWAVTLTREPLSLPHSLSSFPSVTSTLRSHSFPSVTLCPDLRFLSHLACPLRLTLCPVGRRRRPTDANGNVHLITLGNKNHPQLAPIYAKIEDVCKKLSLEGCSCQSLETFLDGCGHSEKLTLAFALINTPQGMPVHITKKTRVCRDCHLAILLISKVERRKIHVKGANSIHMFENGKCTCENYCWCLYRHITVNNVFGNFLRRTQLITCNSTNVKIIYQTLGVKDFMRLYLLQANHTGIEKKSSMLTKA